MRSNPKFMTNRLVEIERLDASILSYMYLHIVLIDSRFRSTGRTGGELGGVLRNPDPGGLVPNLPRGEPSTSATGESAALITFHFQWLELKTAKTRQYIRAPGNIIRYISQTWGHY